MSAAAPIPFDNSYARLPGAFYTRQAPDSVPAPALLRINQPLAQQLGLDSDWLQSEAGLAMLCGNRLPNTADPIATVYAGHQFGSFNPQLGDGRAILLGELLDQSGERFDIQLKGAGRTPYSRGGDGKSPLGPVLREYIVSEAMYALGVPTSRALAAVTTGETVYRESALPGAILTRVARSHIRIGTLQFFAARERKEQLQTLLQHIVERHYPDAADSPIPALAVFEGVVARQAALIARWQGLGFIHGVMNTDNMLLSGETIDYGPCAFMEAYHPGMVFSSIDSQGRYAFGNQPAIAQWNLAQLAQALMPLVDDNPEMAVETLQQALNNFPELFFDAYHQQMANKLGLTEFAEADESLYQDFLDLLAEQRSDFTLAFRRLSELAELPSDAHSVSELFDFSPAFDGWLQRWRQRIAQDSQSPQQRFAQMRRANPVFIPRNHLVEETIVTGTQRGDFQPFHDLLEVVSTPFDYRPELKRYASPATPDQQVTQTFCGT